MLTSNGPGVSPTSQDVGGGGDIYTEILADTPTAFWKLDEASGNFADSSVNSNTLTASGTIDYRLLALTRRSPASSLRTSAQAPVRN